MGRQLDQMVPGATSPMVDCRTLRLSLNVRIVLLSTFLVLVTRVS